LVLELDLNEDFKEKEKAIDELEYAIHKRREKIIGLFSQTFIKLNRPVRIGRYQVTIKGSEIIVENLQ